MAPPVINDEKALLEIALITLEQPQMPFAMIYRKAILRVPAHQHSADSMRRRLQRKFNRDHALWLERARNERRARHAEQRREMEESILDATRRAHEAMRPMHEAIARSMNEARPLFEAMERSMEQARPLLQAAQTRLQSPEMQQALNNVQSLSERLAMQFPSLVKR